MNRKRVAREKLNVVRLASFIMPEMPRSCRGSSGGGDTPVVPDEPCLLLESGGRILLESGGRILLGNNVQPINK